jgi:membrane protein DedA with SNARE-associated domain
METWFLGLAQHGYSLLSGAVFLEAMGLPIPAALALLVAGGASAGGSLSPWLALAGAVAAMLAADTLLFLLGRYTGWWLLGLLCRISLNPESCILRSAGSFHKRGRILLLFAKFVPGLNTMAPPLAGSMNMRLDQFLGLDAAGTLLYVGSYFSVGFVFSGALGAITRGYQAFGRAVSWALIAAAVGYLGLQVWMWRRNRSLRSIASVAPAEAARALASGDAVIYDVRSHGYYETNAVRIQGSTRLDPNALSQSAADFPADKLIYLYCT